MLGAVDNVAKRCAVDHQIVGPWGLGPGGETEKRCAVMTRVLPPIPATLRILGVANMVEAP